MMPIMLFGVISVVAENKKQTVSFLHTAEIWSIFSATDVCRCGPQTADVLPLKRQTTP
ncbi:hypothetical protein Hdeb2414_s0012g00396201 [Helianthus debilis subsp. tardiflorus]